jgi:hypothetical protein
MAHSLSNEMSNEKRKVIRFENCGYYYVEFLQKVEEELQRKAFTVRAGIDSFSTAEQLAYTVLQSQGYFTVQPQPTSEEILEVSND